VAGRRDVDDVGIRRMDPDPADRLGRRESHVLPGLSGVGRFIDAGSGDGRPEDVGLSRSEVDDVRIGLGDGDVADGYGRVLIEDRSPGDPGVLRLPQAARGGSDVDHVPAALGYFDVRGASADERAGAVEPVERTPLESGVRRSLFHRLMLLEPLQPQGGVGAFDFFLSLGGSLCRDRRAQEKSRKNHSNHEKSPFGLDHSDSLLNLWTK